jgi:serine/threonine-protein kinase
MEGESIQNKYSIIRVLGRDACNETFLAEDKKGFFRRRYVIKKIRPILGNTQSEAARQLLYQEASILKRLSGKNPQIPQLCEYFMDGEDFYLVRRWIEGLTLKQKVEQQGKLSATQVEQILKHILSFLKYIHSYGIIYRQIKPSSIILRQRKWLNSAKQDLPILIYFGGVKELEVKTERLDRRGLVLAHQQEYISPEQERGKLVFASDLYSLGLTAIYLLTGKTPAQLPVDSRTRRLLWHQEVPSLKIHLVRAIDRAICPNVEDRFTTASQMLDSLHSPQVPISEAVIKTTNKKSYLTFEVKVISSLFLLGLSVMGIAFAFLSNDFVWFENHSDAGDTTKIGNTDASNPTNLTVEKNESQPKTNEENADRLDKEQIWQSSSQQPEVSLASKRSLCYSQKSCSVIDVLFVPAFPVGTSRQQITELLGNPTKESKGYWQNSNAILYRFIPSKIDLGYLLDTETKIVRQTEVSFADSVDLLSIQQAAQRLLLDKYSAEIEHQLNQVYLNNSDRYQFEIGNLEGVIKRNSSNQIYIGIWDSAFH